ncbi:MAG: septation protein SpoVG family protein [Candidatus Omnitrophota bacterium]
MDITEVRIFTRDSEDKKLKAFATVTFDNSFVVRNVKIIEGNKGLFVAMPSRKIKEACPKCHFKNPARSKFCNQCGASMPLRPVVTEDRSQRQSEHRDIAHPITAECREMIQNKVLDAYDAEKKTSTPSTPSTPSSQAPVAPKTEHDHFDASDVDID